MAGTAAAFRRGVLIWAVLALIAGLVAVFLAAAAGPLYQHGASSLGGAFGLIRKGAWVGIAAAAAGALGVLAALLARRFGVVIVALVALGLGLGAFIWPYSLLRRAESVPPIHDIATDPAHPPQFIALAPERKAAPNGLDYGGGGAGMATAEEHALASFFASPAGKAGAGHAAAATACQTWGPDCLAAVQHAYYPDIRPLAAPGAPPAQAYAAALASARAMGWKIAAADAASGHIEATATTAWFGFKDDIAIDVGAAGGGSVVNVRSESRLGLSDIGKNAERVRTYLHRLARRLGNASGG